jgi:hypothetical protein
VVPIVDAITRILRGQRGGRASVLAGQVRRMRTTHHAATVVLLLALLAHAGVAMGQSTPRRHPRVERAKVPAVSQASYSEPEEAPSPYDQPAPTQRPGQRKATSPVRQAAHHVDAPYQGEMITEGPVEEIQPFDVGGPQCAPGCTSSCCAPCCPDPCHSVWENLQLFGGVQAFKSEVDQGLNGNFGFQEGGNWGGALFEYGGVGAQVGAQVVQSNLGESYYFEDNRIQFFFTSGLFHRPFDNHGWQGGVVFDWLHDDYYVQMDVAQIRGELSWLSCGHHEFGAWVAIGTTSDTKFSTINNDLVSWEPIHLYSLFYRRYFDNGSVGRFSAGSTGEGQGLLSADVMAPLTQNWALSTGATYIMGRNDPAPEEALTEAWGLSICLVWYPGYKTPCSSKNPYRPLFNVVDNSSMLLRYRGDID